MQKDSVMNDMHGALSHTIRRQIIAKIGNQDAVSYTDLTELGLEPGTLYFHLDHLSKCDNPLLSRTGNKLYSLTKLGQAAYAIMQECEDQVEEVFQTTDRQLRIRSLVLEILSMKPISDRVQADPTRFFFEIIVFLGLYGYFAAEVGLLPVFLFFLQGLFDLGLTILAAFTAWISTFFLIEVLSMVILSKRGLSLGLFAAIPLAFVPHMLIELLWHFIPAWGVLSGWLLTLLLTGIIAWSTYILTISLSRAKTVRVSRAAIVTLIVTNLNLLLLALISGALA
ncbi:MAG: hypothetical protein ACFFE2_03605 [Candidatus Thorarchaeota archaeon]